MNFQQTTCVNFFIVALCLLLGIGMLEAAPTRAPPNLEGIFGVSLNVSLLSYNSNLLIRGNHDGSVTANGLLSDINTHFTLQVAHRQYLPYAEIAFRSVADHTRFLVLTSQGIRLEAPRDGNHVFRSSRWVTFPEQLNRGRSFYQINSALPCFIAFRRDGSQPPAADLCSNPTEFQRLIGIHYHLDNYGYPPFP